MTEVEATALWQFNEAVSLLRECAPFISAADLSAEVTDALPAMQVALEAFAAMQRDA